MEKVLLPLNRKLFSCHIHGNRIDEIYNFEGREYVLNEDSPTITMPVAPMFQFTQVYSSQIVGFNKIEMEAEGKPGNIPRMHEVLRASLVKLSEEAGVISPDANGILITLSERVNTREAIKGSNEFVPLKEEAFIDFQLVRYVPATEENRKRLEDIFGMRF